MAEPKPTSDCFHDMPTVEPNGDISGPGVLAGFLGTAYLAILVLLGYYLFAFDPTKNPYAQPKTARRPTSDGSGDEQIEMNILPVSQSEATSPRETTAPPSPGHNDSQLESSISAPSTPQPSPDEEDWAPNFVDVWFLTMVRKLLHIRQYRAGESAEHAEVERAFNDCIRSLCDIQLMTGVGILLSGYCTLYAPDGGGRITAYHWQIAVYLAWLSNLTHTTSLTFLRKYLARHTTERRWRVISMTGLFLLILVSMQPLVYFNWDIEDLEAEAQPARASSFAFCFFRLGDVWERMRGQKTDSAVPYSSGSSAILSMCLLTFSFATRLAKLTSRYSRFIRVAIRRRASNWTKRLIKKQTAAILILGEEEGRPIQMSVYRRQRTFWIGGLLTGRLYADLYTSMLSEVYWAIVAGAWVSIRIFVSRESAKVDEDEFTFGQVLAIFLLASPIITTFVGLWPLRSTFPSLRQPRETRPAEPANEFPTNRPEIYDALADSTRSYDMPLSTLVVTGACVQILWATGLYFWDIITFKNSGATAVVSVIVLAVGQPFSCLNAYWHAINGVADPSMILPTVRQTTGAQPESAQNAGPALSKTSIKLILVLQASIHFVVFLAAITAGMTSFQVEIRYIMATTPFLYTFLYFTALYCPKYADKCGVLN